MNGLGKDRPVLLGDLRPAIAAFTVADLERRSTDPREVGSEYRGCANVVMPAPCPTIPSHADLLGSAR